MITATRDYHVWWTWNVGHCNPVGLLCHCVYCWNGGRCWSVKLLRFHDDTNNFFATEYGLFLSVGISFSVEYSATYIMFLKEMHPVVNKINIYDKEILLKSIVKEIIWETHLLQLSSSFCIILLSNCNVISILTKSPICYCGVQM